MATAATLGLGVSAVAAVSVGMWVGLKPAATSQVHIYYIAADKVEWDYSPGDINRLTG